MQNLSFDPRHAWYPVPDLGGIVSGAEWTVEVFTTEDALGLDAQRTRFDGRTLVADGLQWLGGQRSVPGQLRVEIGREQDAVTWRIHVDSGADKTPVKGAKLLLRGLPDAVVETGWWGATTPAGESRVTPLGDCVRLAYPFPDLQTPWLAAGEGPGLTLSARDDEVRAHRFYHYRPHWSPTPVAEVICDELATRRSRTFVSSGIRLRACPTYDALLGDLDAHLDHVAAAHGLVAWEDRTDVPGWAREIDLVLTLHGQHWTGHVFNTFDRMTEILEDLCGDVPGERVMAYLPGWEGRYYWQYPQYAPGEDLGGEPAFARLVATAHRLGVHLMPMFGANGAHVGRYPRWRESVFLSPSHRFPVHVNTPDWDNDRAPEDDQVFLNPGEPGFRAHLVAQVSAVVERYDVDGVFLDTSGVWLDDPRHELHAGYRDLVADLRSRHPGLLVCGEGWYDGLLGQLPLNQSWLPTERPVRHAGLPGRFARTLAHLVTGAPGSGSTGVHEEGVWPATPSLLGRGCVPAIGVVEDTFTTHREEVRRLCRELVAATTEDG
ncbi:MULTISPECIES: family 10 glycosylhydrolase [unclassified Nocardioides]|uniref:family 10 glycosylhydrolase n=1 Tax=unclassified Nocardioides TaxID=2615069 RepID=UPI0036131D7C